VLDDDPDRARDTARAHLSVYLGLPNYVGNLRRMGFGDDDLAASGSDRLLDALVVRGDVDAVRARVDAHLAAGADGIALHVLGDDPLPVAAWRQLAEAVVPGGASA
jgi:probable F420-dependent oxidoreductase